MKILNNKVAVAPFEFKHNTKEAIQVAKGFVTTDRLAKSLIEAKVVFNSDKFKVGQTVYLPYDTQLAALAVYELNGQKFVLLDESKIIGVSE